MTKHLLTPLSTAFIIGLTWYVSINFNAVVFVPLFFLLFYFKNPFPIERRYLYVLFGLITIFLFWALINISLYDTYDNYTAERLIKISFFGFIILTFVFLFYGHRKELLFKSIEYALWVMVLLWFMQFIVYYTSGEYIDLLEPLAGQYRAQRYQAYWIKSALPIDLIRPTSIFIEPGTYAVNTLPLLILSYMGRQRLTKLHIAVLFSYFASISLFAIFVATMFILITELSKFKFKLTKKNVFLFFFFSLLVIAVSQYLYFRFVVQGGTDQVAYRESVIGYWLAQDSLGFILGNGGAQTVVKRVMVEDASFIFMLIFEYGIFAFPYLGLLMYISWGLPLAFLVIILVTKLNYMIYVVWFYIGALTILRNYRVSTKSLE
ncbi:MAG TPA: hypothetical protein ENK91_17340 [Bacteroidetes bacterium]|nr:hypothetical protein [Bacteroidota bacterium]